MGDSAPGMEGRRWVGGWEGSISLTPLSGSPEVSGDWSLRQPRVKMSQAFRHLPWLRTSFRNLLAMRPSTDVVQERPDNAESPVGHCFGYWHEVSLPRGLQTHIKASPSGK